MSFKSERELSAGARDLVKRAKAAYQTKNLDYSIDLWQAALVEEPTYLEGRRYLRAIEIEKYKSLSSFNRQMVNMKMAAAAMKLSSANKKESAEQMAIAEEVLELDPFHHKANTVLGDAGAAIDCAEIKAFAYETIAQGKPGDKNILHTLAATYMDLKDPIKAGKTYERILEIDPRDGDALSGLRNASAADASTKGGWEQEGNDYRNALKSKAESEQLEQESKVVKSGEAIEEQIRLNFAKHQEEPNNPNHSKAIAALFQQKNDFTQAIQWYQHAFDVGGKVDSSLEKLVGDLKLKNVELELEALKEAQTRASDPEQLELSQNAIEQKIKELDDVRLFQAEARVRAYPNEGQYHFELGEALYKVKQYKRALPELQLGLRQPSVRYQAMNLMGLCFMAQRMFDLAIRRFAEAAGELPNMDEVKMEIVYNLGLAYEATRQHEKALEDCWKKIYEVDMSYRDVAKRVEDSYGTDSYGT